MPQNDKKFFPSLYLRKHNCDFGTHVQNNISGSFFLFFQNSDISGVVKGQNTTQNCQFQSVMLHISGNVDHIINICGTQV